jgi:hypothetical protein
MGLNLDIQLITQKPQMASLDILDMSEKVAMKQEINTLN